MISSRKRELLGSKGSSLEIKKICMRVISLLQDYKRGDIVVTLAVLWLSVCERFDVEPNEALSVANKMRTQTFDNKHSAQFRALKDYINDDL